jgi:hypothetical protein
MTLTKNIILFITCIFNYSIYSQEIFHSEQIEIGKFKYTLGISETYFLYEENTNVINFELRFINKYQLLGSKITYRMPGSSANYNFKVDDSHPSDVRATYKDGIILSTGELKVNFNEKTITVEVKYVNKDNETLPDSSLSLYQQKKNGFFELIKIIEVSDGKENVVFKK